MTPIHWFIIGFVLVVLEIIAPGFVIFWFGIAGVITAVISFFVHNAAVQWGIFVVLSGILVFSSQKIARRFTRKSPESVGSDRLSGVEGIVTKRICPPDMGMVKVLGDFMRAEAEMVIEEGCRVRVKRADGTHVVVEPECTERTSEAVETGGKS